MRDSRVEPVTAAAIELTPAEAASFEELYRRDYRAVVSLVYSLCGSRSAAEELTQDAFVVAHRRWRKVSGFADPGAWVRNVAMNNARSAWRRRLSELRAMARMSSRREPLGELSTVNGDFWRHVRELPAQQAKAVALYYIEDLPIERVAAILNVSEGTVKTHLSRARARLAECLEDSDELDG